MRVQYDRVLEKVFESEGTRKYRRLNRRLNVGRTGSLINHRWLQSAVLGQMNHLERESQYYFYNNIHENISQFWLAESSAVLRKYSAIKRNAECFTSVVLRNVFSLWKYWQSEENKLLWTWSNGMVSRAIWKHTHALVSISKTSNNTRLSNSCHFDSLWKTHLCVFQIKSMLLPIQIFNTYSPPLGEKF